MHSRGRASGGGRAGGLLRAKVALAALTNRERGQQGPHFRISGGGRAGGLLQAEVALARVGRRAAQPQPLADRGGPVDDDDRLDAQLAQAHERHARLLRAAARASRALPHIAA